MIKNFDERSSGWLVIALVLGSAGFVARGEVYFGPWYWTLALSTAVIGYKIASRFGTILALSFMYWVLNPIILGQITPFSGSQHIALLSMQSISKDSAIFALLFTLLAISCRDRVVRFKHAFCFLWIIEAISLLLPRDILGLDGFLGNTTIGCCFLVLTACMLPEYYRTPWGVVRARLSVMFVTTLFIPFFHSATAFAALVPMWLGCYWFRLRGDARRFMIAPPLLCLSLLPLVKPNVFLGRDRYELWSLAIEDFWQGANHWFGYGHGTYKYLGPQIQITNNYWGPFGKEVYLWLHNDWLQIFFEGGYIGFALSLLLYFDLLRIFYCRRLGSYCAATLIFGFIMCTQYPLELPVFALFGFFLIIKAYSVKQVN